MYSYISHLECSVCEKEFPHDQISSISECCAKVLFARYDLQKLKKEVDKNVYASRESNMWRFSELLPVTDPANVVTLGEGGTPLLRTTDLGKKLNLNNLTFHLPFDKVEYEPEQFPGLIYRLDYPKVVCLIFGSGKMVITGARHKDEILEAVQIIKDELADLL